MVRTALICAAVVLCSLVLHRVASAQDGRAPYAESLALLDDVFAANAAEAAARTSEEERAALWAKGAAFTALSRSLERTAMDLAADVQDHEVAKAPTGVFCGNRVGGGSYCACGGTMQCLVTKGMCVFGGHNYEGGSLYGFCKF